MARRQDHSPAELQALTIRHVQACLQQQPASELSLRQIARDIGYSPGTLINQFGSYALLLLSVNAHTLDQLHQALLEAMQPHRDDRAALTAAAFRYLDFARQHPHAWRLLLELRLPGNDPLPVWQEQRILALFALLEQRLAHARPGSLPQECQEAARVLWAAVQGICQLTLDDKLFSHGHHRGDALITSLMTHYLTSWVSTAPSEAISRSPLS